jgi:hypothetical protein
MGSELKCRVKFGKQQGEGRVLLETSEIIFRGEFRLKIPFAKIKTAEVAGENLRLGTADGLAELELGAATAAKWREKILHPKSRIDKLGVKPDAHVTLIGFGAADQEFLDEVGERTKHVSKTAIQSGTAWIFLKADTEKDLAQLSKLHQKMHGAMALWIIFPKGNIKGQGQITESDIFVAGRATGLKDVKVVGFSATHTGLKFVIPVEDRK